jgi:hypothetical protein
MALAVRAERQERATRATAVRSRVHGEQARTMVKTTATITHVVPRPQLVVVAPRRRAARLVAAGCAVVFGLMIGAAAFQTQLARRQLTLDTFDRKIRAAHEQYDVLRRERAELRSPGRLATEARALGMVPATQTDFITLDADVIAAVQRSGAPNDHQQEVTIEQEFAAYARVKAQAGSAP